MTTPAVAVASLDGVDPRWSRVVSVADSAGTERRWHVLDNAAVLAERGEHVIGTLVCVHGNPTWSYLWRRVIEQAPPGWRVVAPDQLGMGLSERTEPRRLADRIDDLGQLLEAVEVSGPTVLLAHDWGGPIGLGWALRHRDGSGVGPQVQAVVLTNTAVHQPGGAQAPTAITLARTPGVLDLVCRRTPAFVRATTALSRPALPRSVRDAFARPYRSASARSGVADFVADIPLRDQHPSAMTLDAVAAGLEEFATTPALLVWGTKDPVFSARYLDDLIRRLPHADVQRYPDASHLVLEDRPEGVGVIWQWITGTGRGEEPPPAAQHSATPTVPITVDETVPERTAIVELTAGGSSITAGHLASRVRRLGAALAERGVRPGDRVAVLVPPGIDLTTLVYALWRLGAVVVIADAGLGVRRLGSALRGAMPMHVVAIGRGLTLARVARVPGQRIRFERGDADALVRRGAALARAAGTDKDAAPQPHDADPDADAAVLFTSGSTGPPKGVVYSRRGMSAQVALLRDAFDLRPGTRFVAAFAPFALYGPALGLTSAVPDMDVTAPHTLTAAALADAVERVDAGVVFASPAALRNVVATASQVNPRSRAALGQVQLVLSAGAPVPVSLLRRVQSLMPAARTETPYGMTEALPVASIDPTTTPGGTSDGRGVCVGAPLPGVTVTISPLDDPDGPLTNEPNVLGEIVVQGPHVKSRYDRLWATQSASASPPGWHRTGDVGLLDDRGRLWVHGRRAHLVHTAAGPVAPYGIEQRIEALPDLQAAAVVGVGPPGTQQVVVVVVPRNRLSRVSPTPLAPGERAARVRAAAGVPVAAVLQRDWLPVDIRHASKVDRLEVAQWATRWLHGRSAARELRARTGRSPTTRSR